MQVKDATRLRQAITDAGMSYTQVGAYAGCSRGFVSQLVNGHRNSCTPWVAAAIAEAVGRPIDSLFTTRASRRATGTARRTT